MAKNYDVRLNVYLDKNEPKDKTIIDFLDKKYSAVGFIKETIYALATGASFQNIVFQSNTANLSENTNQDQDEEYEPIKNIDSIDI